MPMISMFGIVSIFIFLASLGVMVLYYKIMKRRGAVDEKLTALDNALRERLEIICENAELLPKACERCENFPALDTRALLKSFQEDISIELIKNKALAANILETEQAVRAFNEKTIKYNTYISKFPVKIMAHILGLYEEEEFRI